LLYSVFIDDDEDQIACGKLKIVKLSEGCDLLSRKGTVELKLAALPPI